MKWVLKTSTLRVATGHKDRVYRSMEEVPPELQQKVRTALQGPNSETIFIANQEAYDHIADLARDLPPESGKILSPRPGRTNFWRLFSKGRVVLGIVFSTLALLSLIQLIFSQIDKP